VKERQKRNFPIAEDKNATSNPIVYCTKVLRQIHVATVLQVSRGSLAEKNFQRKKGHFCGSAPSFMMNACQTDTTMHQPGLVFGKVHSGHWEVPREEVKLVKKVGVFAPLYTV